MTRAPQTRANCNAKTETPPEPWVRTVSPAVTRRWPVSATQAVTAAQGKVAASSKDRWLGRCTTASSLKTAYSASIPSEGVRKVLAIVRERIPKRFGLDPVRDIQVLCPMNRGGLGARSLNIELQNALNPPGDIRIERFGWTFCPGDKVMQVENDYDKEVY